MYSKENPRKHDGDEVFFDRAVGRKDNDVPEQVSERTYGKAGRLFFGTRKGYMGRGVHCVQKGDLVVVLHGGKVPFVLRENEEKDKFLLIGECCEFSLPLLFMPNLTRSLTWQMSMVL